MASLYSTAQPRDQTLHHKTEKVSYACFISPVTFAMTAINQINSIIFTLEQATKVQRGVKVKLYSFFNLGARQGWVVNATPRPRYPRERPGTHSIGGCVGPRACLDGCGISRPPPTAIRSPDRPARSESLYRLSYPGPCNKNILLITGKLI